MMDAVLVENFHAAHRQRRSGMLRIEGAGVTQQVAFSDGNPVAIDVGVDKEHLLADALLRYHRITAEFHQAALAVYRAGHATVTETVLRHQAATEAEIASTTQSMVEDALCRVFSERSHGIFFDDGVAPETLDFERRAFRLRIEAELLLRTIGQRIDELRALAAADPSWSAVYALAEHAGSSALAPFEKLVLNVVDGQRSVEELAEACRDSSASLARVLANLEAKGFVRRLAGRASTTLAAMAAPAPAPAPVLMPSPRPGRAAGDFVPVHRQVSERPPFPLRTLLMTVALAVAILVGWLVLDYETKRRALQATTDGIVDRLAKSDWRGALDLVVQAEAQAGGDLEARREVDGLRGMVTRALDQERSAIIGLAGAGDASAARERIAALPPGPELETVRAQVAESERQFEGRSRALVSEVEEALRRGDMLTAISLAAADPKGHVPREREAARESLDRWRAARLDEASVSGSPLRARRSALDRLRASSPSESQGETADRIARSIEAQARVLGEAVHGLSDRLRQGQADEVAAELERLHLAELTAGSEYEAEVTALRKAVEQARRDIDDFRQAALEVARDPARSAQLSSLIDRGETLAARTGGAAAEHVAALVALLRTTAEVPADLAPELQAERVSALADAPGLGAEEREALAARALGLRQIEAVAAGEIAHAQRLRRDGDFARAVEALSALVVRPDLLRTEARRNAERELVEVQAAQARRSELKAQLDRALAAGDGAAAGDLAREMGMPYLPLVVDSIPRGATVSRDGRVLGPTPQTLDIGAAERVDLSFGLSMPGYQPLQVVGAQAEGGWRLLGRMERIPAAGAAIPQVVTSRPVALSGRVVAAGRLGMAVVTADGRVEHHPFLDLAVEDPVYAPAVADGAAVLVPTRNRLALRIAGSQVQRIPLAAATDVGIATYVSDLVVGRRLVLVAGTDGRLHAGDGVAKDDLWAGGPGAGFAAPPLVVGDRVLAVRQDGELVAVAAEDGQPLASASIASPVLAAWPIAGGFAGITEAEHWQWRGGEVARSPLPFPASAGGIGVALSPSGRVAALGADGAWREVGRCEAPPSALCVAWRGHAVIPQGRTMAVLGERGFSVRGQAEFLPGAVAGERLVLIDQSGQVRIYTP